MLRRLVRSFVAVLASFRCRETPELLPRSATRRAVWDNGTNYDIPAYLRRSSV